MEREGEGDVARSDVLAISPDCYLSVIELRSAATACAGSQFSRQYHSIGMISKLGNKLLAFL